jgi:hypothetical protein
VTTYRAKVSHPALGWCERLIEADSAAEAAIVIVRIALGPAQGPDYDNAILEHAVVVSVEIEALASSRGVTRVQRSAWRSACANAWTDATGERHVCWLDSGHPSSHNDGSPYFWG